VARRRPLLIREDDSRLVLANEAGPALEEYLQAVGAIWRLAGRYWFDALILGAVGLGLAIAVAEVHTDKGPNGPVWLDAPLVVAMVVPLFARRRFPFGAPVAVALAVTASSLLDNQLISQNFIIFLSGCAAVFLMALLPNWRQAIAGLAIVFGAEAVVARTDPSGGIGDFFFSNLIFGVV
jgi:hypothetical protein